MEHQNAIPVAENPEWLFSLRIMSSDAVPMALRTALRMDVFEILSKHGRESKLSTEEIMRFIPASNPKAPGLLDRLLRLLSCHDLLQSAWEIDEATNRRVQRYGLSPNSKFYLNNESGRSIAKNMLFMRASQVPGPLDQLDAVILKGQEGDMKDYGKEVPEYYVPDHSHEMQASHHSHDKPEMVRQHSHATPDHKGPQHSHSHHSHEQIDVVAMMESHSALIFIKPFLQMYDGFKNIRSVVDVGGSTGYSLNGILERYPHLTGINYDQPSVVASAPAYPRMKHIGGTMLDSVPSADAVFLKMILHDWNDEDCMKILRNCRQAIPEDGKVIVVDTVMLSQEMNGVGAGVEVVHAQMAVLCMASHGTRQRTPKELVQLGLTAGLSRMKLVGIIDELTVLEFSP